MNVQELNQLVQKSSDKFSILTDEKIWSKLSGTLGEATELVLGNLNEDEIFNCLKFLSGISETQIVESILKSWESTKKVDFIFDDEIRQIFDETHLKLFIKSFDSESITKMLVDYKDRENEIEFVDKESLIASMSIEGVSKFLKEQKDYLEEKDLKVFDIVKSMDSDSQLKFIDNIDEMELSENDVKKVLVKLKHQTKEILKQREDISDEMKAILDINYPIEINFEEDNLEKYEGLDEFISLRPEDVPFELKDKVKQLCHICPDMKIKNLSDKECTPEEYLRSEEWIDEVLSGIDENWSDIQKVAYVDHAIGKKVSYSPDYDTEVFNENDARSIWRIIDSGYGVCNGIASIEGYILDRLGIENELVFSKTHAFLKLVDIELPQADGKAVRGNTLLDPTWNLAAHQYGTYPYTFCKSYEEIRKFDINKDGIDQQSHKNDEELSDVTYEMEEQVLREVFKSIGLAREDGRFPSTDVRDKSDEIGKMQLNEKEAIEKQLTILQEYNPNFAKAQNSTAKVLKDIFLSKKENIPYQRCVIKRVYDKQDEQKRPVQYIYLDMPRDGKLFYYVDKDKSEFVNISQKDFEERFECYEMDLQATNGIRPWQTEQNIEEKEDLNQSSGKVAASEGREEI